MKTVEDWRAAWHAACEQGLEQEKRAEAAEALADDLENQISELMAGMDDAEERGRREGMLKERKRIAAGLAVFYEKNRVLIAQICDEQLDQSGAMLGWVRSEAIERAATAPAEET